MYTIAVLCVIRVYKLPFLGCGGNVRISFYASSLAIKSTICMSEKDTSQRAHCFLLLVPFALSYLNVENVGRREGKC